MIIVLITVFGILELQSAWDVKKWGALIPNEMGFGTSMFFARHIRNRGFGEMKEQLAEKDMP